MAYIKNTWKSGDVVTAEKLNNIENGIESKQDILSSSNAGTNISITEVEGVKKINVSEVHPWNGAIMANIGDSITWGYDGTSLQSTSITPWWKVLRGMLNATSVGDQDHAYGINGSTIAVGINQPMCNRFSSMDNSANLIFVFGGTNDFDVGNVTMGEQFTVDNNGVRSLNLTTTTFYGGLNTLIKGLLTKYPNGTIVLCTPLHRGRTFDSGSRTEWEANSENKYLNEYVEAERKVAEWFGIPVIDFYNGLEFYPQGYDYSTHDIKYFLGYIASGRGAGQYDALHPNQEGHNAMARYCYEQLKRVKPRNNQ